MMRIKLAQVFAWSFWLIVIPIVPVLAGTNEWTQLGTGITASVNAIGRHPGQPQTLYAGTENGFYFSANSGRAWELRGPSLVDRSVLCLAVDPEDGDRLYVGLNSGLSQSSDGGQTWSVASDVGPGVLAVGTGAEGRVYAATFGRGVFSSLDRGATWTATGSELASDIVFSLAAHPLEAQVVYAGTARGLFVSRDGGQSWISAGAELDGLSVRSIALSADVQNAGVVVIGTYGRGVWMSEDNGQSWNPINEGLGDLNVRSIVVNSDLDQWMYAATANSGFYRSKDGGATWRAINQGLNNLMARWVEVLPDSRVLGGSTQLGIVEIHFEPEAQIRLAVSSLDFGMVEVGVPSIQTLELANDGLVDLVVSNLSIERESGFSVSPASIAVAPGTSTRLEVRFQPALRGPASATLVARSNDPDEDAVEVALSGTGVQAELGVQPPVIDFGEVRVGSFRDTMAILTNRGNAALNLRNAFIEIDDFRVLSFQPQILQPNQSLGLPIRFLPQAAGGMSGELVIVDAVGRNEVAIDGMGIAPYISLSATVLDFGTVDLQNLQTLMVEVSNSGNTALEILDVEVDGQAFSVDVETPFSIAPGQFESIPVTFMPLEAGSESGILRFVNDTSEQIGTTEVTLSGAGGALALRPLDPLATGTGSSDLLVVDLDQDGTLDLALVDSIDGQLRIHFNDGTGHFADSFLYPGAASTYGHWDRPVALAAAPIFGNGIDLIIGDPIARSISILFNDGTGNFDLSREDIFIGHQVADIIATDLDADADVDIAVANSDDASVTVLLNNGEGTFNARVTYQVGEGPAALLAAHIDADDHADLVVANRISGSVSVLLGNRNGSFMIRQDLVVGLEPVALAMVDYDADGDNDLLVGNQGSLDVAVLKNEEGGVLVLEERVSVGIAVDDLALSDLTADIFSDLVVGSSAGSHLVFLENEAGVEFVSRDILSSDLPVTKVGIADFNADGANDIAALLGAEGQVQIFLNEDARRLDPPRAPTRVRAADVGRDLGRQIEVLWAAPELDEQIGRTTEYVVFRAASRTGPFASIDTLFAGQRRYVDTAATLADTFYYYVIAGNVLHASEPSAVVAAASRPAPFYELEMVDESRFSVGDTLRLRAFLTPAEHDIAGLSLFMSYEDSALTLIDADLGRPGIQPFRIEPGLENAAVLENRLQPLSSNKLNLSLAQLDLEAGVEPIALGEVWFHTSKDTVTFITIDDEPESNRRSSVVETETGEWILPFIPKRVTQVSIRDFLVRGQLQLEGRDPLDQGIQASLFLVGTAGDTLESPLNDEDRLRSGIQHTLQADGTFSLVQIPADTYRVLAKAPTHLQGVTDTISVGMVMPVSASFSWVSIDSMAQGTLPAGDANDDNRINLADFGVFVQHFGRVSAEGELWPQAGMADFNGDERVDVDDFFLLAQNFGEVGMKLDPLGVVAARRTGTRIAFEGGKISLQGEGDIVGFSLLVLGSERVGLSTVGTIWEDREKLIYQWSEGEGTRIAGALVDPARPLRAEGLLAVLDRDQQVVEVELLRPDGRVEEALVIRVQPRQSALQQNYPNPFNPATTIPFAVGTTKSESQVKVRLDVYNIAGQQIRTLVADDLPAGLHRVEWDGRDGLGRDVASGAYLYRLQIGEFVQSRRLLLLR